MAPLVIRARLVAKGLMTAGVRELMVRALREEIAPELIVELPDARISELEGLPAPG